MRACLERRPGRLPGPRNLGAAWDERRRAPLQLDLSRGVRVDLGVPCPPRLELGGGGGIRPQKRSLRSAGSAVAIHPAPRVPLLRHHRRPRALLARPCLESRWRLRGHRGHLVRRGGTRLNGGRYLKKVRASDGHSPPSLLALLPAAGGGPGPRGRGRAGPAATSLPPPSVPGAGRPLRGPSRGPPGHELKPGNRSAPAMSPAAGSRPSGGRAWPLRLLLLLLLLLVGASAQSSPPPPPPGNVPLPPSTYDKTKYRIGRLPPLPAVDFVCARK